MPYPIFIPLPVPVPIPFPLLVPVEAHTPSHTSPATGGQAHAPLADQGDITLTGVCVKAENPSSPHTHANTHTQAQAAAVAHSARSDTEEEEEEENDEDMEEERETEVEEEDDDNKVHDKNPMMNRQREEWRERWREREVIQSLTLIPPVTAETEAHGGAGEKETADESDWSSGQHTCAHNANNATLLKRHTLSPHTHVIHLTHTAQTALTHSASAHATSAAVQGLADQKHLSQSPHITHTNSSYTHLPTVPRVAICAVSQTVVMPTDSSHKLSPPLESSESQSEELKENCVWNGQCHELTDSQAHKSDGSRGAEEESPSEDEEHTHAEHTPAKHTNTLKRDHTQMESHTQSLQEHSEEKPEEKKCCLQIRDQNS